jgi:hypothetical protein
MEEDSQLMKKKEIAVHYRKIGISIALGFVLFLGVIMQPILANDGYKTFSVKLNLGLGYSSDSDLGSFVNAFDDYAREIADEWVLTKSGNIQWTDYGCSLGGEFIAKISQRFGLSIGIGYILKTKKDHVELGSIPSLEGDVDFRLKVIPMTLSANYFIPVSRITEVFVKGGIGYYLGQIDYELLTTAFGESVKTTADIRDKAFGLHIGAGIEYKVSKGIALFVEGAGRLVKFSDWRGNETETAPYNTDISGPVWLVDELYSGFNTFNYYPALSYGEEPINSDAIKNARRFSVDISGFTFQMGVRLDF